MKYKVYGIVSICLAFVMIASSLWFSRSEKKERYHQHLMAEPKAACSHSDDLFCSHLPLIQIDTDGVVIGQKVNHIEVIQIRYKVCQQKRSCDKQHIGQGDFCVLLHRVCTVNTGGFEEILWDIH